MARTYGSYSADEKVTLGINLADESEFLEELSSKITDLDDCTVMYSSWNATAMLMTIEIECLEGVFKQTQIERIIEILGEMCVESFYKLRKLGWCSGYNMNGVPGRIEFTWLNQSKNRSHRDKERIVETEQCCCMSCNFRFLENV